MDLIILDGEIDINTNELNLSQLAEKKSIERILSTNVNSQELIFFIENNLYSMDQLYGGNLAKYKSNPLNVEMINDIKKTISQALSLINISLLNLELKIQDQNKLNIGIQYQSQDVVNSSNFII